jgi:CRP/FNR family cyclic AMP-dependent transcriptional regulator
MKPVSVLHQADIFADISPAQLDLVASLCQIRNLAKGDLVFEENVGSDELYVIAEGEVDILVDPALVGRPGRQSAGPTPIARLRRGQSFGEIALVDQGLRSASARSARDDTQLVVIPRDRLILLCESDPILGYRLMRNLAADLAIKLRNTDLQLRAGLLNTQLPPYS